MKRDKLTGADQQEAIKDRLAARELAQDAAMRGCDICGGLFALEDMLRRSGPGLGFMVDSLDYDDEDDEERPY
jgi:hypothetical protein